MKNYTVSHGLITIFFCLITAGCAPLTGHTASSEIFIFIFRGNRNEQDSGIGSIRPAGGPFGSFRRWPSGRGQELH
ncbi:MAG: hypothetical protein KDI10_18220, partial [Halioglobus sp.]|nr:hypothetical protein [Halioglobus sp.]